MYSLVSVLVWGCFKFVSLLFILCLQYVDMSVSEEGSGYVIVLWRPDQASQTDLVLKRYENYRLALGLQL
jgi:hypothetical protein